MTFNGSSPECGEAVRSLVVTARRSAAIASVVVFCSLGACSTPHLQENPDKLANRGSGKVTQNNIDASNSSNFKIENSFNENTNSFNKLNGNEFESIQNINFGEYKKAAESCAKSYQAIGQLRYESYDELLEQYLPPDITPMANYLGQMVQWCGHLRYVSQDTDNIGAFEKSMKQDFPEDRPERVRIEPLRQTAHKSAGVQLDGPADDKLDYGRYTPEAFRCAKEYRYWLDNVRTDDDGWAQWLTQAAFPLAICYADSVMSSDSDEENVSSLESRKSAALGEAVIRRAGPKM